jgi:hypothetical protein
VGKLEVHPPGDWSQEDFEEETPLVRKADYDALVASGKKIAEGFCIAEAAYLRQIAAHLIRIAELQAENDRLNMEMLAYRQALTPKDLEAMTSVIKALTDEKARRSKAHP